MGKLNKQSDSEDAMEIEPPQAPAKHKKIKKNVQKSNNQTIPSQQLKYKSSQSKIKTSKVVEKLSKLVNLPKTHVQLSEKQGIFKKIVQDMKGDKKVRRKDQKKQRVLIKKKLRQEFQEKLPTPPTTQNNSVEAMQEQKRISKKEKFQQSKVVQEFKKNIGLKFGSLKQILARKAAS